MDRFQLKFAATAPLWFWDNMIEPLPRGDQRPNMWGSEGAVVQTASGPVEARINDFLCWDGESLTVEPAE